MPESILEYACYVHVALSVTFVVIYLWRWCSGMRWPSGSLPSIGCTHAIAALLFHVYSYVVWIAQDWASLHMWQTWLVHACLALGGIGLIYTTPVLLSHVNSKAYSHLPAKQLRSLLGSTIWLCIFAFLIVPLFQIVLVAFLVNLFAIYSVIIYITATQS